ncbi:MAG TPA: 50S ribosomal protein L3 [Clostridia bacterium]|mgnify:FL=1|jgi:large subunit ribosomal protein L3|nr:50S ribosomal protein L3 [Clostridia bacterium]HOK81976.1 50S ribosomal protein L3 [Clostridia bacterium]HOL61210.1 50S ribosomal protein L3 [Clostridia bacterium]HPO53888.1 50S ribosomal protein L3 [Clostridia bacterium]
MEKAIIGRKLGMSQIFAQDGTFIPVTVIEAGPCSVVQVKTELKDGYNAIKVGFEDVKEVRLNKPLIGQYKQAGVAPKKVQREFRLADCSKYAVGQEIKCDIFAVGDHVDVTGTTRGRGFTGTVQRWNTHKGPMAHGSGAHRIVGSMSANTDPSRVFKNKKMPGQYGHERVTIQNLEVVKVDAARNIIMIAGGIPGPKNSLVVIANTCKKVKASKWFKAPATAKAAAKK